MLVLKALRRWFEFPHRLIATKAALSRPGARVLDIGCGNHSPTLTKAYFPHCVYHGLDRERWNNDAADAAATDHFYPIDLESEELDEVGDEQYDVVICSHVLEHLSNPESVATKLARKLKANGMLYIEVPSSRSMKLPRAKDGWFGIRGCLNFYDDETHVTLVDLEEIRALLTKQGYAATEPRYRFLWRRVVFWPLYAATGIALRGYIPASVMWDVTGFAKYIVVTRPSGAEDERSSRAAIETR